MLQYFLMDSQVPIQEPRKVSNWLPVAAIALFVLLSLITIAFLYNQNQQLKKILTTYQTQPSPTPASTPVLANWETKIVNGWKVYKNIERGFEFQYPANSDLETPRNGYHRIQNYSPLDDKPGLGINEFYLEFDLARTNEKCKVWLVNPDQFGSNNGIIYKGLGVIGGDAGGTRFALCAEKDDKNILIQVTEGNLEGKIANQILSTFKFIEDPPTQTPLSTQRACTMEAKMCPDGSFVGRTDPNCEFAPCPTVSN